ncbi:serine carboxypeptidase [Clavulina sp. PMI_390]|nr:serine carboxypeptidase [Clavulina sp. PMI_390]
MFQRLLTLSAAALSLSSLGSASQLPLGGITEHPLGYIQSKGSIVAGSEEISLNSLSANDFTTFTHPNLPSYALRIKQSPKEFCDHTVNSYSGYLDVGYGTKHLFFYFFESRNDPDNDDVLMWINGGPGCSSSLGLFMELGPCSVENPLATGLNGTKWNPSAWNTNANLFFLDQPVGVGFSYAEYGQTIGTTEDAAKDVDAFVQLFFETFSQFKGRPFHMSGESYGGRYIPVFASAIVDSNARAKAENRTAINLKSVLIGNGMTDTATMFPAYHDMLCTQASVEPPLDIASCVAMKTALPRCEKWYKKECIDRFDAIGCDAAATFCGSLFFDAVWSTGKNIYDLSKPCDGGIETLCYPVTKNISTYLDQPHIRAVLGVDKSIGRHASCNNEVGMAFSLNLDSLHQTKFYVAALLERSVRVLIYVGVNDWICNWKGNQRWVEALEWSGHDDFAAAETVEWKIDGKVVGATKNAKGLTFTTILGAGHMVPYDKPTEALTMLQAWFNAEKGF